MKKVLSILAVLLSLAVAAYSEFVMNSENDDSASVSINATNTPSGQNSNTNTSQTYRVVRVIDGDTIDVSIDGETVRVRYVGVNTPEREEVCYQDAVDANKALVEGKRVRLVKDVSDTDQYGRWLRFVYVGDTFVNETLLRQGYAESVRYDPDTTKYDAFVELEKAATRSNLGCHPTGIFDDGSYRR